ncbi:hypothetical protein ACE6H2_011469 [Prunus campanulata]
MAVVYSNSSRVGEPIPATYLPNWNIMAEFEKIKQQLAKCLGIPRDHITVPNPQMLEIMTTKLGVTKGIGCMIGL